ncbi:MAG: hypothetical protein QN193_08555 [Armatimonadota bacterium]|nr:hypothetical protein [Armatimonadota bacterium]MDR7570644.1 hypothetical protein [Armatimonadota bacterium]MDR7615290.1 hypothetical protein [Armatimonadota bacterium]
MMEKDFWVGALVLLSWTLSLTSFSLRALQVSEEDRLPASLSLAAAFAMLGIPLLQLFR